VLRGTSPFFLGETSTPGVVGESVSAGVVGSLVENPPFSRDFHVTRFYRFRLFRIRRMRRDKTVGEVSTEKPLFRNERSNSMRSSLKRRLLLLAGKSFA